MIHIPRKIHNSNTKINNHIRAKLSEMMKTPGLYPMTRIAIKSNDPEVNDHLVRKYEIDPNSGSTVDAISLICATGLSHNYKKYLIEEYGLHNSEPSQGHSLDMPVIEMVPDDSIDSDIREIYIPEIFYGDVVSALIATRVIYILKPSDTLVIQSDIPIPELVEHLSDGSYIITFEQIIKAYPERHVEILDEFPLN